MADNYIGLIKVITKTIAILDNIFSSPGFVKFVLDLYYVNSPNIPAFKVLIFSHHFLASKVWRLQNKELDPISFLSQNLYFARNRYLKRWVTKSFYNNYLRLRKVILIAFKSTPTIFILPRSVISNFSFSANAT